MAMGRARHGYSSSSEAVAAKSLVGQQPTPVSRHVLRAAASHHAFRSARRHAARLRTEDRLGSLELENASLRKQINEWESWWRYSSNCSSEMLPMQALVTPAVKNIARGLSLSPPPVSRKQGTTGALLTERSFERRLEQVRREFLSKLKEQENALLNEVSSRLGNYNSAAHGVSGINGQQDGISPQLIAVTNTPPTFAAQPLGGSRPAIHSGVSGINDPQDGISPQSIAVTNTPSTFAAQPSDGSRPAIHSGVSGINDQQDGISLLSNAVTNTPSTFAAQPSDGSGPAIHNKDDVLLMRGRLERLFDELMDAGEDYILDEAALFLGREADSDDPLNLCEISSVQLVALENFLEQKRSSGGQSSLGPNPNVKTGMKSACPAKAESSYEETAVVTTCVDCHRDIIVCHVADNDYLVCEKCASSFCLSCSDERPWKPCPACGCTFRCRGLAAGAEAKRQSLLMSHVLVSPLPSAVRVPASVAAVETIEALRPTATRIVEGTKRDESVRGGIRSPGLMQDSPPNGVQTPCSDCGWEFTFFHDDSLACTCGGLVCGSCLEKHGICRTCHGKTADPRYRTKICRLHAKGLCSYGKRCLFAHGQEHLRSLGSIFSTFGMHRSADRENRTSADCLDIEGDRDLCGDEADAFVDAEDELQERGCL